MDITSYFLFYNLSNWLYPFLWVYQKHPLVDNIWHHWSCSCWYVLLWRGWSKKGAELVEVQQFLCSSYKEDGGALLSHISGVCGACNSFGAWLFEVSVLWSTFDYMLCFVLECLLMVKWTQLTADWHLDQENIVDSFTHHHLAAHQTVLSPHGSIPSISPLRQCSKCHEMVWWN